MKSRGVVVTMVMALLIFGPQPLFAQAEDEVRGLIDRWGQLWNENNPTALLEMYHPDAKITYGWGNQKGTASKKEYEGILPQRIAANPSIELKISKVKVKGEKANVSVAMKTKGGVTRVTFELTKQDEKWLIMAFKY
jgi:uncharacterized protein (TIGR02246 family)